MLDAPTDNAASIQVRAAEKQKEDPMVFSGYKRATPTGFDLLTLLLSERGGKH